MYDKVRIVNWMCNYGKELLYVIAVEEFSTIRMKKHLDLSYYYYWLGTEMGIIILMVIVMFFFQDFIVACLHFFKAHGKFSKKVVVEIMVEFVDGDKMVR